MYALPIPRVSGAQGYDFTVPKECRAYKPYYIIPALKNEAFEIVITKYS